MIEKINVLSSCHHRLHSMTLKAKSRIGHKFKHNIEEIIYGMEDCTFTPQINEDNAKRKYKVFSNSDRLHADGKKYKERKEKRIREHDAKLFKPDTTSYHFQDVRSKPKKGEKLGLTPRSLHTKYYREMDFSPYRVKKNIGAIGKN